MVILNELQSQIGFISEPMQQLCRHASCMSRSATCMGLFPFIPSLPPRHAAATRSNSAWAPPAMWVACHQLIEKAKQVLGVEPGQTTKDGTITLEICRCVGACSQAPVIVIDEDSHGRVRPNKLPQLVRASRTKRGPLKADRFERAGITPAGYCRKLGVGQGRYGSHLP